MKKNKVPVDPDATLFNESFKDFRSDDLEIL